PSVSCRNRCSRRLPSRATFRRRQPDGTVKLLEQIPSDTIIAGRSEVVLALFWGECRQGLGDGSVQALARPGGSFAQRGFELGEGHLERIEIGRVGRQVQELRAGRRQHAADLGTLVGRQIVTSTLYGACSLYNPGESA